MLMSRTLIAVNHRVGTGDVEDAVAVIRHFRLIIVALMRPTLPRHDAGKLIVSVIV